VALVTVDAVATLASKTSLVLTEVVQPLRLPLWASCELDNVAGALALILLPLVGMPAFTFQMSTVMDPDGLALMSTRLIVQEKSAVTYS